VEADSTTLADAVASLGEAVRRDGAILRSAMPKHGVGRAFVLVAETQLAAAGLEVAGKYVRVPLAQQLEQHLQTAPMTPLRSIADAVRGASKREATIAARTMVAARRARLVVRSRELMLASAQAPGLDERDLGHLETAVTTLGAALKLARKNDATLLRADVEEALRRVLPAPPARPEDAPQRSAPRPSADVLACIDDNREASGLTSLPRLVRALGGASARARVHEELLRGARAGTVELRPESGMGRLAPEDAALCIDGPQGSRLSWVRRIEGKS
jgi:hypothetical protein